MAPSTRTASPAANTALPTANEDPEQMKATEDFLKNEILSVDIFALSPAQAKSSRARQSQTRAGHNLCGWRRGGGEDHGRQPQGRARSVTAPLNRVQRYGPSR